MASSTYDFEGTDIFKVFNASAGQDLDVDPYPVFELMRAKGPVVADDLHELLGIDKSISLTASSGGYRNVDAPIYSALSYEAVDRVFRDSRSFTQEAQVRAYVDALGPVLTSLEGTEHRRTRSLVEQAFTKRSMEVWDETVIVPASLRCSQALQVSDSSVDLIGQFIFRYPAEVITGILGLPEHDTIRFMRYATACVSLHDPQLASWGHQQMTTWIDEILDERREHPSEGSDVLSLLLNAQVDSQKLSNEEIATFIRFLYPAGFETTYRALSNTVVALLRSGQWRQLVRDRTLLPQAIEEGLRWETSILGHPRVASSNVELCGTAIPKGAVVLAFHGAANRDPTRWNDPATFDISRPIQQNATFGFGVHLCLGKRLAQVEIARALTTLMDLFPDMALDPEATEDEIRIRGVAFRSPRRIPVLLR